MKLVRHPTLSLPVENHDSPEELSRMKKHGELLPDSIRCLVIGPSNCGKTNALLSLLIHPNGVRFQNIYLFSKSVDQPKYRKLREILEPLDEVNFFGSKNIDDLLSDNDKLLPDSVVVFDDLAGATHTPIMQCFSYARHFGADCFYLGQTYTRVPKQLVRDNANMIILFKQDDANLRYAYEEHVGANISWPDFRKMCAICWAEPHGFITIDKDGNNFRKGFDHVFDLR